MDSGIRSGVDIAKAIASGAGMTLSGRALLYGLAAGGEAGVCEVLDLLKSELDTTLALLGCPRAEQLSPRFLAPPPCSLRRPCGPRASPKMRMHCALGSG